MKVTLLSVHFRERRRRLGDRTKRHDPARSSDEGKTWVPQESTTRQNLYSLNFNKKIGWAVGGEGIVLRYDCELICVRKQPCT